MSSKTNTWPMVRLGDIGQSLIGLTYSPSNVKRSGTLVLRSSNIQGGRLVFNDCVFVDSDIPDRIRVRENDILICVRNGSRQLIGKSILLDRRVVGQTFGAFMAVYRSDSNPFLQYFFQSDHFKHQIDGHLGATINQITNGSLNSFVVALPSAAEQREIASRLIDADRLITTLERMMVKRRAVKQGMMQQLLTGKTRLPGFTEAWGIPCSLLDLCEKRTGYWGSDAASASGSMPVRVIRAGDITSEGQLIGTAERYFSRIELKYASCHVDDVVITASGSGLGKTYYARGQSRLAASNFVRILRPKALVSGEYLSYVMGSSTAKSKLETHTATSAYPNLLPSFFTEAWLTVPSHREQLAIAKALRSTDDELDAYQTRLTKAKAIKQGMMQELLTGRTRLPASEATEFAS